MKAFKNLVLICAVAVPSFFNLGCQDFKSPKWEPPKSEFNNFYTDDEEEVQTPEDSQKDPWDFYDIHSEALSSTESSFSTLLGIFKKSVFSSLSNTEFAGLFPESSDQFETTFVARIGSDAVIPKEKSRIELCTKKSPKDLYDFDLQLQIFAISDFFESEVGTFSQSIDPHDLNKSHVYFKVENESYSRAKPAYSEGKFNVHAICSMNTYDSGNQLKSICSEVLIVFEKTRESGATQLFAFLARRLEHYIEPFVDLKIVSSTIHSMDDFYSHPVQRSGTSRPT